MTQKKNRLEPIINVADNKERSAALELAKIVKSQEAIRGQMERLKGYCEEYRKNEIHTSQAHAMFADRRLFLSRLNQTVLQLEQQYELMEKRRAISFDNWKKSKARIDSLLKYTRQQIEIENQKSLRSEQKEMDDIAGRLALRTSSS